MNSNLPGSGSVPTPARDDRRIGCLGSEGFAVR